MSAPASTVSPFVASVVHAAAEAVSFHVDSLTAGRKTRKSFAAVATALEYSYDADLDEMISVSQKMGFQHSEVSKIFQKHLHKSTPHNLQWGHVADANDALELFSLRTDIVDDDTRPQARGRTRASAIVQNAMFECRASKDPRKASRASEETRTSISIPSPLAIAYRLLTEPNSEASRVYAGAALRQLLIERIAVAVGNASMRSPSTFADQALSDALDLITNRWKTSKPIRADLSQNGPEVLFLCNVLAMVGAMVLRVDIAGSVLDQLGNDPWLALTGKHPSGRDDKKSELAFWVHPQCRELPDLGTLLNVSHGLPLPIEGAGTVFCDGLRYAQNGSIIAAITGSFGVGKTSVGLSLAASLAPLGCRTLFLTCEEKEEDIESRLGEAVPRNSGVGVPLFANVDASTLFTAEGRQSWFFARELILKDAGQVEAPQAAAELKDLVADLLANADLFDPVRTDSDRALSGLPSFAKPIVIIDGLHQLFARRSDDAGIGAALLDLVQEVRKEDAIVIFTFADENRTLRHLDYHCDIVVELERVGFDRPDQRPERLFKLIKSRRQPSRPGAHIFHIHGPKGFRIKPMLAARTDETKALAWFEHDKSQVAFLGSDPPGGFKGSPAATLQGITSRVGTDLLLGAQALVIGKGSSGKAGFGLYTLHRRSFDAELLKWIADGQSSAELTDRADLRALRDSKLPVRLSLPYYESRVLVVSFLYQQAYYDDLTKRLRPKRGKAAVTKYGKFGEPIEFEFGAVPNRLITDTISLYPGHLGCENFLAKIEARLNAADAYGRPYTGVLIDGLHNVFVQFPGLEQNSSMWPELFSLLRRRALNVVTTYTKFDVRTVIDETERDDFRHRGTSWLTDSRERSSSILDLDYEQAQRKASPLLSALVSAADYLFELSAITKSGRPAYQLRELAAVGREVVRQSFFWDRQNLELSLTASE